MMNRRILFALFGLVLSLGFSVTVHAQTNTTLDTWADNMPSQIDLPAAGLTVTTITASKSRGGGLITAAQVSIGGTVGLSDIAEVCVFLDNATQLDCATSPGTLSNLTLTFAGQKQGSFDYRISLNSSAAGKTINFTVENMTGSNVVDNIPLPQTTATVNIAGSSTPPAINTPTFTSVLTNGATLGGNITGLGTSPIADDHGTVWDYTSTPTANASSLGTPSLGAFTDTRSGMNTADQVFFRAFVEQSATRVYTVDSSFHTYPANDSTGFSIDQVTENSMRINWTDSSETGDAGGSIVIVSEVDSSITAPLDGNEYTGDASYPFSVSSGTNDFVVYRGQAGGSVTLTSLPSSTQFWVAIYSYSGTGTGTTGVRYKAATATTGTETTNTPLTAPTVTVQAATAIGTNGVTLHGSVTVNGTAADNNTYFKYGTSSGVYTVTTGSAGIVTTGPFSLAVTGLDPSTTYYYIACATANESGGLEGCSAGEQSFTTDKLAPTVTVQAATSIGSRTATLNGTVTVNGSAADNNTYFKYGTSSGSYTTTTGTAGTVTTGTFSLGVTGLEPSTIYYYIACATANETGGLEGCSSGEQSFTTDPLTAPTVTVLAATSIGSRAATLNGTVTVNGSATDNNTYFKYGTSSGVYTVTTGTAGSVSTGTFSLAVTGLDLETTYYYIACATANETGGLEGCSSGEQSFTTNPLTAPTVTVQAATSIGSRTATLNGTITVNGSATDNNTYFEYGTSSGAPYDTTTATVSTIATESFALPITGLEPSTTYYYRACAAANEAGGLTGCSTETSFTTDPLTAPTVTVQAASAIGTNSATLNGNVTVNGSATDNDTYFKYGINSGGSYDTTTTSAGTVATGTFSQAVAGLDSDITYYYIACATANETGGLEGCSSGEESFITVASVSQPTNPWFHNTGSTSMTLFWTKGIGDGSIVVMKQGSAVSATPVDGTEHIADSVLGSGADLGGGNFVVYRGTGEAVHVTGLTEGLTYHVAIYTYTGAGALIEYLLPGPAIGNETTTANTPHNVAILNIDDTVGCTTGCHGFHGSAVIPRGAAQETMCTTCHNPAGMPGALDKLNFSLHTNATGFPAAIPGVIEAGVVDCGSCHELHNPSGDDTTLTQHPITSLWANNLYYLRANPQKYVSTALPWPTNNLVVHDPTEWAFEDGAAYEGACQICHTNTPSAYQNTSAGDDTHMGGDLGDVNCKGCHDHGGGFAGAGGDCTACHNSIQDKDGAGGNPGRRIVTTEFSGGSIVSTHLTGTLDAADCEVCHDQSSHQAGQVKLFEPDGGTSISIASYTDPRVNSTEAAKLTAFCEACHDSNGANGDTTPFTTGASAVDISADWANASHNTTGAVSCFGDGAFGCHGSGHGGQKLTILAPAESGPGTDNSDEREAFCFTCHDSDGMSTLDILADFSGSAITATSASTALVNNRHDVLPIDQAYSGGVVTCNDCHQPHLNTDSRPVANPDDSSALASYSTANQYQGNSYRTASDDLDPTDPLGVLAEPVPDYIQFCLTCHDGTAPPGVTMPSNMLNIASGYFGIEQHGNLDGQEDKKGYLKAPFSDGASHTANSWAALNCTTCHDTHGSVNIFNLRESITVGNTVMRVGGQPGSAFDNLDSATYTLPLNGGVQTDHYWGAWCSFCHELTGHNVFETSSCQSGHMHGQGNF